jgi:hypothetical protein
VMVVALFPSAQPNTRPPSSSLMTWLSLSLPTSRTF